MIVIANSNIYLFVITKSGLNINNTGHKDTKKQGKKWPLSAAFNNRTLFLTTK